MSKIILYVILVLGIADTKLRIQSYDVTVSVTNPTSTNEPVIGIKLGPGIYIYISLCVSPAPAHISSHKGCQNVKVGIKLGQIRVELI